MKEKLKENISGYVLLASIFIVSTIIALIKNISITTIMKDYQFSVLIILIVMELFTNLISSTGIIEKISLKISVLSKGNKKKCLILFGILIFFVSAFLNNITAVLIVLPIIFVLLKAIGINQKYVNIFFAVILALSNTGGASSPIGDFPAIVIMNSGITSFKAYLFRAFPFFFIISIALIFWWQLFIKENDKTDKKKNLSIDLLQSKYKNIEVNKKVLNGLLVIFVLMFICWSTVPQDLIPPEVIALLGCVIGIVYSAMCGVQIKSLVDFKPVNPKKWIRLRTNGVKNTITVKEIIDNQVIDGTNELEVEVSDFNIANLILKELGYVPRNYQENYRIIYNLNGVQISIDTWPKIPTYVELEAKSEELIKKLLSIIEYNEKDLTTLDVASIYMNVYGIDIMSIKELTFDSNSKNLLECNKQMQQKL